MRLRIRSIEIRINASTDDGETLRDVQIPLLVEARDLAKLADLVELARAKAEHRLQAEPTTGE